MSAASEVLKEQVSDLIKTLRLIFPLNKKELFLLAGIICLYFSFSVIIATKSVIMHQYMDAYFSFDNSKVYHSGVTNYDGHPLMGVFTILPVRLGNLLVRIFGPMIVKNIFLVLLSNFLVASSALYIYRYLKSILNLKGVILYSILAFYVFSWTCLTLSFTFESFTFCLFFLSFIVCYYSSIIKKEEKVSLLTSAFLAISAGGITLTNFAKGLIPILFLNEKKKIIINRILIVSALFILIYLCVIYMQPSLLENMEYRFNRFTFTETSFLRNTFDFFWGSSFLYPPLSADFIDPVIMLTYYQYVWQYVIVAVVGILVLFSIIFNYRNKFVQMLSLFFLSDIVLHLIVKYGIDEAFLYSGHWFFLVPLFLGWFYYSIPEKYKKTYTAFFLVLVAIIIVNNIMGQIEFVSLALDIFPRGVEHQ